jgi:dihydroorotate dehydrogenase (fumarate)
MGLIQFDPPILNSATPWATTLEDLRDLYSCPFTGAVTVRTSTLDGFAHDDRFHQFAFFEPTTLETVDQCRTTGSLNTLGYSPIALEETLNNIEAIVNGLSKAQLQKQKPFIVSITGSAKDVSSCIEKIVESQLRIKVPLLAEINLSCPNISGKPPPAFTFDGLCEYFHCLADASVSSDQRAMPGFSHLPLRCGIKTPPYSNPENFTILKRALLQFSSSSGGTPSLNLPLHFVTATNTLGCCLLLDVQLRSVLSSVDETGIGGIAGAPLHPLALGNVYMIRKMLDSELALKEIRIIGVGGVHDQAGRRRMMAAGADVVAIGTALGRRGLGVFKEILGSE